MADRVYPGDDLHHGPPPPSPPPPPPATLDTLKPPPASDEKPLLPQETYIIQIPKDQIYRVPPPENSRKMHKLANRKPQRSRCCRCLCWTIAVLFILLILLAIAAAVLYLVFRPEPIKYSVQTINIGGINLTSSAPLSPRFTVGFRAQNPNDKLSVFYHRKGSAVDVHYAGVNLCSGELPEFHQASNNVTVIQTALRGSDIVLARDVHAQLVKQEREGKVPLRLRVKAPVRVKMGGVKTWEITVTVKCDVGVDRFSQKSKIVSSRCGSSVKLW